MAGAVIAEDRDDPTKRQLICVFQTLSGAQDTVRERYHPGLNYRWEEVPHEMFVDLEKLILAMPRHPQDREDM